MKTVKTKLGNKSHFETFLLENYIELEEYCSMSDGTDLWQIIINNYEALNKVKELEYVMSVEDTAYYSPSQSL